MRYRPIIALMTTVVSLLLFKAIVAAEPPVRSTRPVIGITSTVEQGKVVCSVPYVRAVADAGGLPIIVPPLEDQELRGQYLQRLDGLVLIGGWDIPPSAYGAEPHPTTEVLPSVRWEWEHRLIQTWLDSNKPLLGICLGAQMTNVVKGGTLIQDIPSEIGEEVTHRSEEFVRHLVTVTPGTRLHGILGREELLVQSSHHQAVERVGKGLKVVARSEDRVIEALEGPGDRWLLLLQWHPERMGASHHGKIFGAFLDACR
ncbi:MAG: gamma-glutamyl-gamma-aminobutyrate hydrolase family protein [Planctomycetota bacterium]